MILQDWYDYSVKVVTYIEIIFNEKEKVQCAMDGRKIPNRVVVFFFQDEAQVLN